MRKTILFPLVLALALTFCPPARAVEPVVPAPPSWCPAEEYAVFADGAAYETATWDKILSLREHAGAGNPEPQSGTDTVLFNRLRELKRMGGASVDFEVGLLKVKYALNAPPKGKRRKSGPTLKVPPMARPARRPPALWPTSGTPGPGSGTRT